MAPATKRYYTSSELAEKANCSESVVKKSLKANLLAYTKNGKIDGLNALTKDFVAKRLGDSPNAPAENGEEGKYYVDLPRDSVASVEVGLAPEITIKTMPLTANTTESGVIVNQRKRVIRFILKLFE